jgi:hypothetical protein
MKQMTQAELQWIEHCNKVLGEHSEVVTKVLNDTEAMLNNYVPIMSAYVQAIDEVRHKFGMCVADIIKSSRQLQIITGSAQDVINFTVAVQKLDTILTPELIEKLQRISNAPPA